MPEFQLEVSWKKHALYAFLIQDQGPCIPSPVKNPCLAKGAKLSREKWGGILYIFITFLWDR